MSSGILITAARRRWATRRVHSVAGRGMRHARHEQGKGGGELGWADGLASWVGPEGNRGNGFLFVLFLFCIFIVSVIFYIFILVVLTFCK